jgi:hypothetical protein
LSGAGFSTSSVIKSPIFWRQRVRLLPLRRGIRVPEALFQRNQSSCAPESRCQVAFSLPRPPATGLRHQGGSKCHLAQWLKEHANCGIALARNSRIGAYSR